MTLSTSDHRDSTYALDVLKHQDLICPESYTDGPLGPFGMSGAIEIGMNRGRDYIQNFSFHRHCERRNDDILTIFWTTIGYDNAMMSGDWDYSMLDHAMVRCPSEDHVATGIQLRYDTRKGNRTERSMARTRYPGSEREPNASVALPTLTWTTRASDIWAA